MPPVRHIDDSGELIVRDGVLLAFFTRRSFEEFSAGVAAVLDRWLMRLPEDALQWAKIGANAEVTSPINKRSLERCRRLLDPKKVKNTLTAFSVEGPEEVNPGFRFDVVGATDITTDGSNGKTNLVEMRFPTEFVEQDVEAFVSFVVDAAGLIPFDSGYCSPALNFSSEGALRAAAAVIVPLALRHPGYDVNRNRRTRFALGRRSRGARWITFLADSVANELGGSEALRGCLDPGVELIPIGENLALRTGSYLEVGDMNRNENLPLLRSVARAIEPVSFFGDVHLESGVFRGDTNKFQRWERRFLD
jgi:hypothetical protein